MKTKSEQMKGMIGLVEKVMKNRKDMRYNDNKLCVHIWTVEMRKFPHDAFHFCYSRGELTSADSITRLARMVRTKHGWKKDKRKEEAKVKKFVKGKKLFA